MDLSRALDISAAGMSAPTSRLRMIAETLANQDSPGPPRAVPYRRNTAPPATDARGCMCAPDVHGFVAAMDPRAAGCRDSANLAVVRSSRGTLERTIEFLG